MNIFEMMKHPWSTLRRVQGLDKLPDRRMATSRKTYDVDPDPLRSRVSAIHDALSAYTRNETRISLYENYREMDSDPMIAAVLDAFGDDAGQYEHEHNRVVWVEAVNKDTQAIIEQTLDRVGIDRIAFSILRSMARDGDAFEHVAASPGVGVVALRAYHPWTIARIEDEIGRLTGFAPANEQGEPSNIEQSAVAPHKVLHFRLQGRERTDKYGVTSGFLWGSRIHWRELQLMEDQVVIQRLLRRPDRLLVLMDAAGMPYEEAWQTVKRWERKFHREWYLNPGASDFRSHGAPVDSAKDMILPKGPNNGTSIENFPATNQNDLLRDLDLILARLAAGIGFPLGFIGRGESGRYEPGQSLSRQYQPFAKKATRLQLSFLEELVRMVKIDLAYRGLDPLATSNQFTLRMASVAPIVEIERAEVIQLRLDRIERALRLQQDAKLNADVWIPYVLEKIGGFPKHLIDSAYTPGKAQDDDMRGGRGGGGHFEGKTNTRRSLQETLDVLLSAPSPLTEGTHGGRVGVSSTSVPIAQDEAVYRPIRLNEAATNLHATDDTRPAPLAKREARRSSSTDSAKTRVELLTTLCGAL